MPADIVTFSCKNEFSSHFGLIIFSKHKLNTNYCNRDGTFICGIVEGGKVYETEFDAVDFSSGIYFYRLATDNKVENRKMLLIK